jgi:AhpD family alkylhydroperoxidase
MEARLNAQQASPAAYAAMIGLEMFVRKGSKLEPSLVQLVKVRASQINGCAYCIDIHTKDARTEGETEQRMYALTSWRETPFFAARARAALAWTEALTLITEGHVPDDIYGLAKRCFSEKQNGKATSNSASPFPRTGEIAISANFAKSTGSFPLFVFCLFNLMGMVRFLHL